MAARARRFDVALVFAIELALSAAPRPRSGSPSQLRLSEMCRETCKGSTMTKVRGDPPHIPPPDLFELPRTKLLRIDQMLYYIPMSRSCWTKNVRENGFPHGVKYGPKQVFYPLGEIQDLITRMGRAGSTWQALTGASGAAQNGPGTAGSADLPVMAQRHPKAVKTNGQPRATRGCLSDESIDADAILRLITRSTSMFFRTTPK
jgi:predicted DNA-binding transcriptional regulator AlpA